jgi:WD40 repeat protein
VRAAKFAADSRFAKNAQLAGMFSLQHVALRTILVHKEAIHGVVWQPKGQQVLTWGEKTARLWDWSTGTPLPPLLTHGGALKGAAFSPEGGQILTWGGDQTARLWDSDTGTALLPPLAHKELVIGAVFSHDGYRILTWDRKGQLQVWHLPVGDGVHRAHLDLQLQVQTGTQLNKNGDLEALSPEDWGKKKQQYEAVASGSG